MRKTPVTLGVLSMVFGGLVAAYATFNLVFSRFSSSMMTGLGQMAASAPRRPGQPDPSLMFDKLGEASEDEEDMLDLAFGLTHTSRLGCQIKMSDELDGLVVKLPAATRNMMVDK